VLYADTVTGDDELGRLVQDGDLHTILVTRSHSETPLPDIGSVVWVSVPDVELTRAGQVRAALLVCLARRVLKKGDRVICLSGEDRSHVLDTLTVLDLGDNLGLFSLFDETSSGDLDPEVFERVLTIATQVALEGREGRPVGALFVLGDSDRVLGQSRSLVLNPFQGHPESARNVLDPALAETLKEYSALDGAFIVRGDGVVLTAGSHLMPSPTIPTRLAGGLGTRHGAAAGISASTDAVAICISQSSGTVSVFKSGRLVTDIQRSSPGGLLPI
jgi:DNA integrity scanning protein DisA with diadenylate cyclase activity